MSIILLIFAIATQLGGLWVPIEGKVWGTALGRWWAPIDRGDTPTVLAIDDETIARLGPPPWSPETWRSISEALHRQSFQSVVLADPWPRLVAVNGVDPQSELPPTLLKVPASTWDGRATPQVPQALHGLLSPSDLRIDVATYGTGREVPIPDVPTTRAGCELGTCPTNASVMVTPSDVQVLSLAMILDAKPNFLVPGEAGVWIGTTAAPYADVVATPYSDPVPYVIAEAQVAAAAKAGRIARPLHAGTASGWLLAIYLVTCGTMCARPWRQWLAGAPLLTTGAALMMGVVTRVEIPLVAGALATAAAPLGQWVRHSRMHEVTLERLGLMVARSASRAGTLRRRITTEDDLLTTVVDLTKVHAPSEGCLLLVAQPNRGGWSVHGGRGLSSRHVRPEALRHDHHETRLAVSTMETLIGHEILIAGPALLVPLQQGRSTVAMWVISAPLSDTAAFARRLNPFAKWVSDRLALPRTDATGRSTRDLLPTSIDDDALDTMFSAVDEERRRWMLAVRSMGHPVFVADTSGAVSQLNPAMEAALASATLPRFHNVHEMAARLGVTVPGLAARLASMFSEGRPLSLPWPNSVDRVLVIRPILDTSLADSEPVVLGFIGWLDTHRAAEPTSRKTPRLETLNGDFHKAPPMKAERRVPATLRLVDRLPNEH